MPTYFYTAIAASGEKVSGSEAAQDERELSRVLQQKGYLLTTAKTEQAKKRLSSFSSFSGKLRSISLGDKLLFCRNLQVMVSAGIPLPRALDILSAQARDEAVDKITPKLFAKYKTARDFANANLPELSEKISSITFFNNKAKNIKA